MPHPLVDQLRASFVSMRERRYSEGGCCQEFSAHLAANTTDWALALRRNDHDIVVVVVVRHWKQVETLTCPALRGACRSKQAAAALRTLIPTWTLSNSLSKHTRAQNGLLGVIQVHRLLADLFSRRHACRISHRPPRRCARCAVPRRRSGTSPPPPIVSRSSHEAGTVASIGCTVDGTQLFSCLDEAAHLAWSPDSGHLLCVLQHRAVVQVFSVLDPAWTAKIDEGVAGAASLRCCQHHKELRQQ